MKPAALISSPRLELDNAWLHFDGCVKAEHLDKVAGRYVKQCEEHRPVFQATITPPRPALRNLEGRYTPREQGKVAVDGSVLDQIRDGYAISSTWLQPCGRCVLGRFDSLVPRTLVAYCREHPRVAEKWVNRSRGMWPFTEAERRAHELERWRAAIKRDDIPLIFQDITLRGARPTLAIKSMKRYLKTWGGLDDDIGLEDIESYVDEHGDECEIDIFDEWCWATGQ